MKIPTNTKNTAKPYKSDIFDTYTTWKSIPACMRQKMANNVGKELALDDERFAELLKIRTQSDFAKKYGVENSTLSNWNKLLDKTDTLSDLRKWGQKLTKNMLWSFYKNTVDKGGHKSVEFWLQVVEGWSAKNQRWQVNSDTEHCHGKCSLAQIMKETIRTHKTPPNDLK